MSSRGALRLLLRSTPLSRIRLQQTRPLFLSAYRYKDATDEFEKNLKSVSSLGNKEEENKVLDDADDENEELDSEEVDSEELDSEELYSEDKEGELDAEDNEGELDAEDNEGEPAAEDNEGEPAAEEKEEELNEEEEELRRLEEERESDLKELDMPPESVKGELSGVQWDKIMEGMSEGKQVGELLSQQGIGDRGQKYVKRLMNNIMGDEFLQTDDSKTPPIKDESKPYGLDQFEFSKTEDEDDSIGGKKDTENKYMNRHDDYNALELLEEQLERAYYVVYAMHIGMVNPTHSHCTVGKEYIKRMGRFRMYVAKPFYYNPADWRKWAGMKNGLDSFFRKRVVQDHLRTKLAVRAMYREHYDMKNKDVYKRWLDVTKAGRKRWDVFFERFENNIMRLLLAADFGDNLFDIHKLFRLRAIYLNGKLCNKRWIALKPGDLITIRKDVYDRLKDDWKYKVFSNMKRLFALSTYLHELGIFQRMYKEKFKTKFAFRHNEYFMKRDNHVVFLRSPNLQQFVQNQKNPFIITETTFRMFINNRYY